MRLHLSTKRFYFTFDVAELHLPCRVESEQCTPYDMGILSSDIGF
jgi:hypothetical protein